MRLWTLHPRYLDTPGLVALWREALLAQAVLKNRTRGYRRHPQLTRFLASPSPVKAVAAYLRIVHDEGKRRGYRFDAQKIAADGDAGPIPVTRGQLDYELKHLKEKLRRRSPFWSDRLKSLSRPKPHPLFRIVPGKAPEAWERRVLV